MKTYKFEVVVREGSDEFWEEACGYGSTGCDPVKNELLEAVNDRFTDVTVELVEYKNNK